MRLQSARVQNYRSIIDTGKFEIEAAKTIMVGPNEAGKTAILQALQQLNPPAGVRRFEALRDYPRRLYNDITSGRVKPANVPVVTGWFSLEPDDVADLPNRLHQVRYRFTRYLDNSSVHALEGVERATYRAVKNDLTRMAAHMDESVASESEKPSKQLSALTSDFEDDSILTLERGKPLREWLNGHIALVQEGNAKELARYEKIDSTLSEIEEYYTALGELKERMPPFVLYSNYFRVRPIIHLEHLAQRLASKVLDDEQYDYGNSCLLKLLGFTAAGLAKLGNAEAPEPGNAAAMKTYRDKLDSRSYQLNAASVKLTEEIRKVWNPSLDRGEADKLKVTADGQYLKVVVEDDLGVEIELDQRSEGFQWLVSFFVVFFAESEDQHANAILLLDEPGLSLHALKQREFRQTVSRLAEHNQTIYTTHSPFLVGPDELDLVRVVEMANRASGTKVHTAVTSSDPAALLPLQEALGYDLAQSLFTQQRNLVCEGLTDYWYVEAVSALIGAAGGASLIDKIAIVPSNTAGKVVYYATILHAQSLKVAALLDSDAAGDQAASQETLIHTLGQKRILRTKDFVTGPVGKPEIEDLLRHTLVEIAHSELGWDVRAAAAAKPETSVVKLLGGVSGFSKYHLAKAFVRWSRDHSAADLHPDERNAWDKLIAAVNAVLK